MGANMTVPAHTPRRRLVPLHDPRVGELTGNAPLSSRYDMARSDPPRLPGIIRIGRRVLIDLDKLEKWIDNGGQRSGNHE